MTSRIARLSWPAAIVCLLSCPQMATAQQSSTTPAAAARQFAPNANRQFGGSTVSLEDQLRNGLRASNQQQVAFIKLVVIQVNNERLPQAMVNLVYRWSLEKNAKIPFPYFQFAMRELAKRRGVTLP